MKATVADSLLLPPADSVEVEEEELLLLPPSLVPLLNLLPPALPLLLLLARSFTLCTRPNLKRERGRMSVLVSVSVILNTLAFYQFQQH